MRLQSFFHSVFHFDRKQLFAKVFFFFFFSFFCSSKLINNLLAAAAVHLLFRYDSFVSLIIVVEIKF